MSIVLPNKENIASRCFVFYFQSPFSVIIVSHRAHDFAGNVGVVLGIFSPQNGRHADMSAPCCRHDTDHVGDIAPCRLAGRRVGVVSARVNCDVSAWRRVVDHGRRPPRPLPLPMLLVQSFPMSCALGLLRTNR